MSMMDSNLAGAWLPTTFASMVDQVIAEKSAAAQVSTIVECEGSTLSVPVWESDPATAFYGELDLISPSDGQTSELVVTPSKIAGLVTLSNEAFRDANPSVAQQLGDALARRVSASLDQAYVSATTTKGPDGFLSQAYSEVDTGGEYTNLDPFVDAKFAAQVVGSELSHFLMAPDVAQTLAKLKQTDASNMSLLETVEDGIRIAGVRVIVSPHMPAGEVFGIDRTESLYVRRTGTEVAVDRSVGFRNDGTDIRVTARTGFAFVRPAGLVRIYHASAS